MSFPLLNCYVWKDDLIIHLFGSGYKKLHYRWGILILNTCIHAAYVLWNLSLSPWTHNVFFVFLIMLINEYINRFVSIKPFLYSRKTLLATVLYFCFQYFCLILYLEYFYIYLSYVRVRFGVRTSQNGFSKIYIYPILWYRLNNNAVIVIDRNFLFYYPGLFLIWGLDIWYPSFNIFYR